MRKGDKISLCPDASCFSCCYTENTTCVTKSVSAVSYGTSSGTKTGDRYVFFLDVVVVPGGQCSLRGPVFCWRGERGSPRCCILSQFKVVSFPGEEVNRTGKG